MKSEEFAHIRHLTGCNHDQFAKYYGFPVARQEAYEKGKRISEEDEAYLLKILNTFERNMK